MKPIVKWVGGKRKLLEQIRGLVPAHDLYVEPFVGGGAVLFDLEPKRAIISDVNTELVNLYKTVREAPRELFETFAIHENTKEYFYAIRALDLNKTTFAALTPVIRASRFLYLNRSAFNGMWRVNAKGQMNVPYATPKNLRLPTLDALENMSRFLTTVDIREGDFSALRGMAEPGVFFYLDPPYIPISDSENFVGYSVDGFSMERQEALMYFCQEIVAAGASFVLSNSDCAASRNLYNGFEIFSVNVKRTVGGRGSTRKTVGEILVRGGV